MFCDDEKPQRDGVERHVDWKGHGFSQPVLASNGWEALDILEKQHIDLLMTDICMPGMDGLEMLEKARKLQPQLFIVILSGYAEFDFAKRAMANGAREYLLKPLKPADVHRILSDFVSLQTINATHQKSAFVQEVEAQLLSHITDGISVEKLADNLHMNVSHMCTRYRKETGVTIADSLSNMQKEKACMLLATSDLSIGEIAEQTGERTASSFAQWFRKVIGITPSEYRNMLNTK